jgi:uncharacterized protein YbcC (UPF0753/DUF2309 family)
VERACARIAPTWPLDRFIAVNPFWGHIDAPLPEVSARMEALCGSRLVMPRAWFRAQWQAGRFTARHLEAALARARSPLSLERLLSRLEGDAPAPAPRAKVTDVADARRDTVHGMAWGDFVRHGLSQFCAATFDRGQATLAPSRDGGLYASWLRHAEGDHGVRLLMGLRDFPERVRALPPTAAALFPAALDALDVAPDARESYLTSLLLDVNGWAAWCAYLGWGARQEGRSDGHLAELLAIRLAWEWLLLREGGTALAARWQVAMAGWAAADAAARTAQAEDWLLQDALELAYQEPLCRQLAAGLGARPAPARAVQAVFCIDVRSEVFRRALEAQSPLVGTGGFAGFFGLPIDYRPLGADAARPQLPGLLAPRLRAADAEPPEGLAATRAERLGLAAAWKGFRTAAVSGFSYVEALGLLHAGKLLGDGLGLTRPVPHPERAGLHPEEHAQRRPRLEGAADGAPLTVAARCELAAGLLRGMGLPRPLARLVALVGHGSSTVNNPHAAGLDCGACCGQTGEVNARAAAALLNSPEVREGLAARGVEVPADTHFLAALHDTTTDDVTLFDLFEVPATHRGDVEVLAQWLRGAGERARAERAPRLGLSGLTGRALHAALQARARDWGQVRPEWGLADNAAFIAAPRERSREVDLGGRAFLHEYRWQEDAGFATLELLLTAPLVVAHWINLQYYASTVDNARWGSGDKVLHNVVGGAVGVFEGNGGDLRVGLPLQSLHDGTRWVHTPQRLSAFFEAPRDAIAAVLARHAHVRQLADNGWLHLFQLDGAEGAVHAWREGAWHRVPAP